MKYKPNKPATKERKYPSKNKSQVENKHIDLKSQKPSKCSVERRCGSCNNLDIPYEEQLKNKELQLKKLFGKNIKVNLIQGMENPYHYRNKVHAVFHKEKNGNIISGVYERGSHRVVKVDRCFIEDKKADEIIISIRDLLKSFKIRPFNEDTGEGLLRHVLIRKGFNTGEIMVVLVMSSMIFPSKNNFVKALCKLHPEITTIIMNINDKRTSMVLGTKEKIIYGKGYIEDVLCGCTFRISSRSFYQVNPVQTEFLYNKALELANFTGKETVIDAYCGIGTIGLIASKNAQRVIGIELNGDAVRDAIANGKRNDITNAKFYEGDAGDFMAEMAANNQTVDVVMMDPPRSGSTEKFLDALCKMGPKKVIYISCNPETLERDMKYLEKKGYKANEIWPVDMFPHTEHVETVVKMSRKDK